jgi:tRNA (uracil-5-)-methyltransferase TRM9
MEIKTARRLLDINKYFYAEFAEQFAQTRNIPQPGFSKLLDYIPQPCQSVIDVGCGNGRFGKFLSQFRSGFSYTGVDYIEPFLEIAGNSIEGDFISRDISKPGFLEEQGSYDLAVCLATLQHIPCKQNRLAVLKEMVDHITDHSRIFISNWQFTKSDRQMRKILDWQKVGIRPEDVDPNDFLLSWQGNGQGERYVHLIDRSEMSWLAHAAGLAIIDEYHSDGREGNLNHYTILKKQDVDTK